MFSLNFYPEYDVYHAAFRGLCIRAFVKRISIDGYRFVDYFFQNPFDLKTLRMPGTAHRKIAAKFVDRMPYKRVEEPASIAIHMWQFQQSALQALAKRGYIDPAPLAHDAVSFIEGAPNLSPMLEREVAGALERDGEVLKYLSQLVEMYPVNGRGGLKERSGLLDFRYDVVTDGLSR